MDYLSHQAVSQLKSNHLKLILALEEFGRITKAADALATTQPAASRMLADMERILGAELCEREPRGMKLTLIGQAVARRARNLMSEMHSLSRDIEEMKSGQGGTVRVGAVTSAAVSYVVPAIQQLKADSPGVDVHLDVAPSDALIRDLQAGYHDFILGRIPVGIDPNLFNVSLGQIEEVALVVRKDHPLSATREISLAELGDYDWVAQNRGSPIRDAVDTAFQLAGVQLPSRVTNTSSLLATLAILSHSTAITPLSRVVSDLLTGRKVGMRLQRLRLQETIVIEPYNIVSVAGRHPSPSASRLHQLVLSEMQKQPSKARARASKDFE